MQTTWQYDAAGNVTATGDPLGNFTTYYYNAWNQVTEEIQPEPTSGEGPNAAPATLFSYDEMGNLQSLTDPDGNVTSYGYNQLNEKTEQTDPAVTIGGESVSPVTSYQYDLNGNLTQTTDPTGKVTQYSYDNLNRLSGEVWKNSLGATINTISYSYDKDSRLTGGSDDNSTTSLGYNALGELTSDSVSFAEVSAPVSLSLGYDADGNNTSLTATVDGTADLENLYTYDSLNRLTSITQQSQSGGNAVAGKEVVFSYTNIGQVKTVTRYAAASTSGAVVATTTNSYDHDNRLTGISTALGTSGSMALNDAFGYDADGRITSENNSASGSGASLLTTDGAATLGYNNDNELTSVTPASGSSIAAESYSYDAAGNRTSAQTGVESASSSVTSQGSNQVASDANYRYTYDFDGNLITKTSNATGDVDTYTWDNRNRLIEDQTKTSGGTVIQTVTYTYSPVTNQRLSQTVTTSGGTVTEYYVYDPAGNLLIVLDGSGNVKERDLSGLGLSQILATETGISGNGAGTVSWALTNQVGSVTDVLNNTGAVTYHIRYDSFGNIEYQGGSGNAMRFGYAGMQTNSATGLDYDNARYYDPQSGTFISQDPLSFGGGDYDLYRYTNNDPVGLRDATGLDSNNVTIWTPNGWEQQDPSTGEWEPCPSPSAAAPSGQSTSQAALAAFWAKVAMQNAQRGLAKVRNYSWTWFNLGSEWASYCPDPGEQARENDEFKRYLADLNDAEDKYNKAKAAFEKAGGNDKDLDGDMSAAYYASLSATEASKVFEGGPGSTDVDLDPVTGAFTWFFAPIGAAMDEAGVGELAGAGRDPSLYNAAQYQLYKEQLAVEAKEAARYSDYWASLSGRAPVQSTPYDIVLKFDSDGNVIGATTYDLAGHRAYQYEFGTSVRHGEGYHMYDQSGTGGTGNGPRTPHMPF